MALHQPFVITGYHSCDKSVGIAVLNGEMELKPSNNPWDWLGEGIYFWEQNPSRALEYAEESANGEQFNKIPIKTPFVLGATVELGKCLNLIEPESIGLLSKAYYELERIYKESGKKMPENKGNGNRLLDCAVIRHIHHSAKDNPLLAYDSIRCSFDEGKEVYPGSNFTTRNHIQVCLLNPSLIRGYFLPRPVDIYNPYIKNEFISPK